MTLCLFAHPFSSYCQKALIALYENSIPFNLRLLSFDDAETGQEVASRWPIKRMPMLVDGSNVVREATVIIEYIDQKYRGAIRLIPEEFSAALDSRFMDRFFDNYIMTPMQKIVSNQIRSAEHRDPYGVDEAKALLDTAYGWLDGIMSNRRWATGDSFTLADCAAAPSLFYADWSHPIDDKFANVRYYRERLLARPSFARAVDEARQYRPLFPLGAPDRD